MNSGENVYRMWNSNTPRIHNMCGIIWFKMIFYQDKLTIGMVAYMMQCDDWDMDEIEVSGKIFMTMMS